MATELRRAKKAFNVVSIALIDQLLSIFKNEPVLEFFRGEVEKMAADPKTAHVPAANYFGTMNVATKIKAVPAAGDPQVEVVVGEMVVCRDERLFGTECGVVVPALEALGLKAKWPRLSASEKDMVWGYLGRMATHAAQVVVGMQMSNPKLRAELMELSKNEKMAADYAKATERVKSVLLATMPDDKK